MIVNMHIISLLTNIKSTTLFKGKMAKHGLHHMKYALRFEFQLLPQKETSLFITRNGRIRMS